MTDPITASVIATLAFQEFIKSGAGELAKKFTGEAIAKMGQLRSLIYRLDSSVFGDAWVRRSTYTVNINSVIFIND
jgi:hypothetical protein